MHTAPQTPSQHFSPLLTLLCHRIFTSFYFYIDTIQETLIFLEPDNFGNPSFKRLGVLLAGFPFPLCVARFGVLHKAYHWIKSAEILVYIIQESKYTPYQRLAFAWQRSTRFQIDHRSCKFDKYLDTQFVSCKMSHDNFLDKSSLTFLCSRHSHRYFQTTHFSAVKLPSSCSISEHKTDVLYHSYTFILRWWLQLDFHLDLTVLAVRFSRRSPIFVFPNINVSNNKFFFQAHSSKKL